MFDPATETYVNLSTIRKNGVEVHTPVWIAEHDGLYYVFSESRAGKVKRIRNNQQVRLAPCDMRGKLQGDWHDATARLVDDQAEIDAMYPAFSRKYGWQMWVANVMAKLTGRYNKRTIIAISLTR